jgi:hypothetical protein
MTGRSRRRDRRSQGTDLRRTARERRELRIIYVVAEGERTEYDYFTFIDGLHGRRLGFHIKMPNAATRRNGLPPRRVVEEAARVVADPDIGEVWALFDHDRRPDIPRVCTEARREGVWTALSHPAFELWLLLHFRHQLPGAQGGDNDGIIAKLRQAHPDFADYDARRGPTGGGKRINDRRFDALCEGDGIAEAVRQSRMLVDRCPSGCGCSARSGHATSCNPDDRDPSTDVYLLIQSLGIVPPPQ